MKKLTAFLLCLLMIFTAASSVAEVEYFGSTMYTGYHINAAYFPDPVFQEFLKSILKSGNDKNFLRDAVEIQGLKQIDVSKKSSSSDSWHQGNITSLSGIGYLTNVTVIYCGGNQIETLDVGVRPNLIKLLASENKLASIDLSKNTNLTGLGLDKNQLTSIDLSANTALTAINLEYNKLTTLDVSKNTALTEIGCSNNALKTLDVSSNANLSTLSCWENKLKTLDVSHNTKLRWLDCSVNQITVLDVSACPTLANMVKTKERMHNNNDNLDYFFDGSTGDQLLIDPWTKVIAGDTVSEATAAAPDFPKDPADPADQTADNPTGKTPIVGGLQYKISGSKAVVTGAADKNATKIKIPATIKVDGKKYKVTGIKAGAFKGMEKLTTAEIGSNVKDIGKGAFQNCAGLKTIKIKTKNLTKSSVKSNAFKGISKKATFKCPKGMKEDYKTILTKKGAPKKSKFK